jgi:sodium transport system ATP-binding protein
VDTAAISAERLTRRYDDFVAVDGVDFAVGRGEVFGLLGPNGAGKTTLLRMLAGVLEPNSGRALILGADPAREPLVTKARIGFLSGDTALYERLTVRELLEYFGRLAGLERAYLQARVRAVSEALDLAELLDVRSGTLSTGQRQRANLARAFLADPPVLILDEPTSTLDVISGRFVHEAIRRARSDGKAVLLSSHDMAEVEGLSDRVGILVRGRLTDVGAPAALLADSGERSLAELIIRRFEERAPERSERLIAP